MSSGRKALIIIIFLILLALSCFRFYYYATHGEEFFPSMIKRFLRPPEEEPEATEVLTTRLTVNPGYDGTNKEFVYSATSDEEAVVRIHITKTYQYYDNSGDAIEVVETKAYNANSEVLYSGYARGSKKMPDNSITRQEIEIVYQYDEDTISREYTISSFNGSELLDVDMQSSTKIRT